VHQLAQIIEELEDKNRKLNEKLNEVIFNRAGAYKQKTIESLKKGGGISPTRNELGVTS
jgi:GTPase involved in cell partitioning and DNA repair